MSVSPRDRPAEIIADVERAAWSDSSPGRSRPPDNRRLDPPAVRLPRADAFAPPVLAADDEARVAALTAELTRETCQLRSVFVRAKCP